MIRVLIIASALCALLLVGYMTMGKGNVVKKAETAVTTDSAPMENIKEPLDVSSKIDAAVEKPKDVIASISEEAKTKLETVKAQPVTGKTNEEPSKDSDVQTPFEPVKSKNSGKALDDKSGKNWGVLEETQQVLIDTGEILNEVEGRTK